MKNILNKLFGNDTEVFMQGEKALRQFGIRDKIGYLLGDFGNDFTFILSSTFLLKFYTDVMGVDAWIVGLVMTVARFVDAITDITMGRIVDRFPGGKAGKFRPWILRMCGPVAIASFLIYQSAFRDYSLGFKVAWLAITYILWGSVFYTSINIPYGSMASSISAEAADRQSLSTYRTMGATLAGLLIGGGIPLLVYRETENGAVLDGERFTVAAGLLSILAVVAYIFCYFLTTERVRTEHHEEHRNRDLKTVLVGILKNRALLSIIFASIAMLLAQLTMQSMTNYVYPNYYGNSTAITLSTLAMLIAMIIAGAVAKPLVKKYGKAEISVIANLFAALTLFLLFIIRPQSVWVYVIFNFFCWFGLGVFSVVSWALITDVIDYSELKNGIREDGSIYAIYSFARKLGQAAASGTTGALLTVIGYTEATAFDKGVREGIFNISTLVPAIGLVALGLILWFWYPLHKKTVDRNIELLKEKHS